MVSAKMGTIFAILGLAFLVGAVVPVTLKWGSLPELWLLCLWPASVHLLIATIYAVDPALGVLLISKRDEEGTLPTWVVVLLFPYFLVMWGVWFIRHTTCVPLSGEHPYDEVADGIYVGRWPLYFPSEFPEDASNWIDLTAEFPARRAVLAGGRRYVCLPALDCTLPPQDAMIELACEAMAWEGSTYVSCANGHGRSACLAALIIMRRGEASSWKEAFALMQGRRSCIHIQPNQMREMDEMEAKMRERSILPAASGDTRLSAKGEIELTEAGKARLAALKGATVAVSSEHVHVDQHPSPTNPFHADPEAPVPPAGEIA